MVWVIFLHEEDFVQEHREENGREGSQGDIQNADAQGVDHGLTEKPVIEGFQEIVEADEGPLQKGDLEGGGPDLLEGHGPAPERNIFEDYKPDYKGQRHQQEPSLLHQPVNKGNLFGSMGGFDFAHQVIPSQFVLLERAGIRKRRAACAGRKMSESPAPHNLLSGQNITFSDIIDGKKPACQEQNQAQKKRLPETNFRLTGEKRRDIIRFCQRKCTGLP